MGKVQRIHIEPKMLLWIVERRGLNVDEYALKNKNFGKWLSGEQLPTFRQAEEFAKSNYAPMKYLFMNEPPQEKMPIPFFRSKKRKMEDLNVMDMVKMQGERQQWLSDYLKGENFDNLDFVNSLDINTNIGVAASKMHDLLDLSIDWAISLNTPNDAIKRIVERLEELGCIVTFSSSVGFNTKRSISVDKCRGFCLVDDMAPFIFVNSKDSKQAQLFTLAHEFAHILLGFSAGVGSDEGVLLGVKENYCDRLAAVFLVPADLFIDMWKSKKGDIYSIGKKFKVSRWVIARRAKELGLMSDEQYWTLIREWQQEPVFQDNKKSGPVSFAIRAVRANGRVFLAHVNNALNSHKLLYRDAYRLTGMKGGSYQSVINSDYFLGV